MPHCCIHQLVNPKEGKGALWANLIQISEVHTHMLLPIVLLYYHSISQSLEVEDLLNCSSLFQLVYFYLYYFGMLFR